ncbi:MAG: hypothetical protein AAGU11_03945 [Syntrophobacteraceae bacterium]
MEKKVAKKGWEIAQEIEATKTFWERIIPERGAWALWEWCS